MRGACACPRETSQRCFNWQPIAQPPAYMKLTAYLMLGVGLFLMSWSAVLMVLAAAPGPVSSFYRLLIGMLLMAGPFGLRVRRKAGPRAANWRWQRWRVFSLRAIWRFGPPV